MKNVLKSLCILLAVIMQMSFSPPQADAGDCSMLHSGAFIYTDDDGDDVRVVINGDSHIEYHKGTKYTINSKIEWVDACQANVTLVKATLPNFPFNAGTVMNIKVDKVEGNFIYYTAKVKGGSYKNTLKKELPDPTNNK